ncbi:MAG: PHP domain-containing protein, partial [Phycisphaerales bacterium]
MPSDTAVAASALVLTAGLALSPSPVLAAGPAWYAGDLHSHSTYSDGDSPVADLVAEAERVGLDFYVLTDHDSSMG